MKWDGHEMARHDLANMIWADMKWPGMKWDIPVPGSFPILVLSFSLKKRHKSRGQSGIFIEKLTST